MTNSLPHLSDLDLAGKRVLMRVDFNVPLDEAQTILDDARIRASLPSIRSVLDRGGALILMSHLGRPRGKRDEKLSLRPCRERLEELLSRPVEMAPDCTGKQVEQMARSLQRGELLLLENLRFHPGEEKPDREPGFAKALADLGEVYVNDAFGAAHRRHSSTFLLPGYFSGRAASGLLLEEELKQLDRLLLRPKRPYVVILGGAKISTKIEAVKALAKQADQLVIVGAMAFTFLKAKGVSIGASLFKEEFIPLAEELLALSEKGERKLLLPSDCLAAREISGSAEQKVVSFRGEGIPEGWSGVDIGPETIEALEGVLATAESVFWNGPAGVFEIPAFRRGTEAIARFLARSSAFTVIGGGDSLAAVHMLELEGGIDHLSTGGGASLEYLEGKELPALEALKASRPKGSAI